LIDWERTRKGIALKGRKRGKGKKNRGMGNGRVGEGGQESGGSVQTHYYHN